jgi:cytidylate kinase
MADVTRPRPVVAIDGPAGAGKSTLARALAEALGLAYVNTGAMYRAVTSAALARGVDPEDGPGLADLARSMRFALGPGSPPSLAIEGRPSDPDLSSAQVEAAVSQVAGHPQVRDVLRDQQRRLGSVGSVVEGRDIGTVVFPDAEVKIFLLAAPQERVARRQAERGDPDRELAEALERRDARDARTNPLVPAADADVVDTTGRSVEDVLAEVLALVRARGVERGR